MLVLKRATCLLLSFVLVYSPSLALARSGVKSRKFEPQDKEAFKKAWAKRDARTAAKQRKKTAASRSVASAPSPGSISGAVESVYRPVRIQGKDYVYSQIPGKNGRVQAQMIAGKDFEELLVDEYGTGTASTWKVARGNVEVTASRPLKGAFTQIDVRERRAKAFVNVRLQLNPDFKTYRVVASSIDPYKVDHQVERPSSARIQIMCEDQVRGDELLKGVKSMQDLLDYFGGNRNNLESGLTCTLNRYSELIFDRSCSSGEFANSTQDMAAGLAKIFGSIGDHSGPKSTLFPNGRPRYLQCLNDLGFARYSAQAQTHYANMAGGAREMVRKETHRPPSVEAAEANSCQKIDQLKVYKSGTDQVTSALPLSTLVTNTKYQRPFVCSSAQTNDGEYNQQTGQISFKHGSKEMARLYGGDAASGYASLAFHEMLHQAGLPEQPNEDLIKNLQDCCASPKPDSARSIKACGDVTTYIKKLQNLSDAEERGTAMKIPGYAELRARLEHRVGAAEAQEIMANWYEGLNKDPKASQAVREQEDCMAKPNASLDRCQNGSDGRIRDYTKRFFTDLGSRTIENQRELKTVVNDLADAVNRKYAGTEFHPAEGGVRVIPRTATDQADYQRALQSVSRVPGLIPEEDPNTIVVTAPRRTSTPSTKTANGNSQSSVINITNNSTTTNTTVSQPPVTLGGATNPGNQQQATATPDPRTAAQDQKQQMKDGVGNTAANEQTGDELGGSTGTSNGAVGNNTSANMAGNNSGSVSKGQTSKANLNASSVPMPAQAPSGSGAIDPTGAQPLVAGQSSGTTTDNRYQSATALAGFAENLAGSVASSAVSAMPTLATYVAPAQAQRLPASDSPSSRSSRGGSASLASASTRGSSASQNGGEGSSEGQKAEREQLPGDQQQAPKENQESEAPATLAVRPDARSATDLASNLDSMPSTSSTAVQAALMSVGFSKLEGALRMGENSPLGRALRDKGWTIRVRGGKAAPILMNPSGRCFKPDPQRVLVPLNSCG